MAQNPPRDLEVAGWLSTLGVTSLCQWDVLVFLYRHQTTLLGAADLARLLEYPSDSVVVALEAVLKFLRQAFQQETDHTNLYHGLAADR